MTGDNSRLVQPGTPSGGVRSSFIRSINFLEQTHTHRVLIVHIPTSANPFLAFLPLTSNDLTAGHYPKAALSLLLMVYIWQLATPTGVRLLMARLELVA